MAIVIEQFRVLAGLPSNDASKDATIDSAIAIALSLMEGYCNRGIAAKEDYEEKFVLLKSDTVPLYLYPVKEVKTINGATLASQDLVDGKAGLLYLDKFNVENSIIIIYDGGYDYADMPEDLVYVIKTIFKNLFIELEGSTPNDDDIIKSVRLGDMTVQYDTGSNTASYSGGAFGVFSAVQTNVLNKYVRVNA